MRGAPNQMTPAISKQPEHNTSRPLLSLFQLAHAFTLGSNTHLPASAGVCLTASCRRASTSVRMACTAGWCTAPQHSAAPCSPSPRCSAHRCTALTHPPSSSSPSRRGHCLIRTQTHTHTHSHTHTLTHPLCSIKCGLRHLLCAGMQYTAA